MIEQGPNNLDVPTIMYPALCMSGLLPTSNATLFYQGKQEEQLNNRELVIPSGGTLGGGSSINLMMYSRAQRADFDSWKVQGWSTDEMLPYLKKVCAVDTKMRAFVDTVLIDFSLRHTTGRGQSLCMVLTVP